MSTLVVSLPAGPVTGATEWGFALTEDGRTPADHGRAPAALLPVPRGAGAEIVALLPVEAVSWHRVELPKGLAPGTPRLRAALEGLLEEQLLDDPDAVHLALEPGARGGAPAWVAACDRAWLRQALQALEGAGRTVTRIVPEFAPEGPLAFSAIGEPEHATLVASSDEGVLALPLAASALSLLPAAPEDTPRFTEPAVAALAEQVIPRPWTLQQAAQRWVLSARTRWDLAQFDFASSSRARAMKKLATGWTEVLRSPAWRPARWGAVLLVLVNVVGVNALAWKERASLDSQRETVSRTLRDTFPQVRVVVDAPVQMEREVATLRQQTGAASPRDLDALLGALAVAVPPGRAPTGLEYSSGQLRASGLSLTADELRNVSTQLHALGYSASADGPVLLVAAEDAR
ncbi:general secretion pathway protein GspL [Ramlibacter ginsenosidimutans]|uniref:General secretion pathway protein GspL n=1 Tax=Ramlibacter ginsenosidimutans TaxID=502333 RepID=A0A934TQ34_9BURK|nr:type II secretion system protein GspL [Ramlibacter ginsenosidimutans]MBK6005319.1 general secretion pathway protein GspL [Ramlibacter ginsenosidimutans]